jgi:Predicted membrane protein (DUF2232)
MSETVTSRPELSTSRLILLGLSSVVLCISFVMSIFAPFPLALSFIMYGRLKGTIVALLGLGACFLFARAVYGDFTLLGFYICIALLAFGIAEIVLRSFSPVKGLVILGMAFVMTMSLAFMMLIKNLGTTPKALILQQIEKSADKIAEQKKIIEQSSDKDSLQVLQLLDQPELLAKEMMSSFPSYFFIGVFILLWFNMYLVLKSRRLLFSGKDFPYSENNLLNFRVPFGLVLILIAGLILAIWGDQLGSGLYEILGMTLIKCLGIFYFFQGFGVLSELLNFLGLFGFLRTLIVIVTIFTGNYLVAVAGLFDNWFDFRKYFNKQKSMD